MKHGKVRKYGLEVVEKYDGKVGIFKAQQSLFEGLEIYLDFSIS